MYQRLIMIFCICILIQIYDEQPIVNGLLLIKHLDTGIYWIYLTSEKLTIIIYKLELSPVIEITRFVEENFLNL